LAKQAADQAAAGSVAAARKQPWNAPPRDGPAIRVKKGKE
jgi:hypothetical protein